MRVIIVHNRTAGDEVHEGDLLIRLVEAAGHTAAYFSSTDPAWEQAVSDSADLVAAAGGDGTVARVAKRLAGGRVPLAVLPLGTANNIARALGQADAPFDALIAGWRGASRRRFDIGIARGPWGTRSFLESVGAGLMAKTLAEIREGTAPHVNAHPLADGRVAAARGVFRDVLSRLRPGHIDVSADGVDRSGDYLLVEIMNFGAAGPDLRLSDGSPSDGLLDAVLVGEWHRRELAEYFSSSSAGRSSMPALPVYRARRVTLTCAGCQLHLDDTLWHRQQREAPQTWVEVSLQSGALTVLGAQ